MKTEGAYGGMTLDRVLDRLKGDWMPVIAPNENCIVIQFSTGWALNIYRDGTWIADGHHRRWAESQGCQTCGGAAWTLHAGNTHPQPCHDCNNEGDG
jgi:hypothetical protein